MNDYGCQQANLNDILYPLTTTYRNGLVSFLQQESTGIRIVEFGVGTGRIAFSLVAQGFNVTGIDNSESMLDELRSRDSLNSIEVFNADFTKPLCGLYSSKYDSVLLMCNAIFEASDLSSQRAIFRNARRLLRSDGIFIVETVNPFSLLLHTGPQVDIRALTAQSFLIEKTVVDRLSQKVSTLFTIFGDKASPTSFCQTMYLMTPREMDTIAESEGLVMRAKLFLHFRAKIFEFLTISSGGRTSQNISGRDF